MFNSYVNNLKFVLPESIKFNSLSIDVNHITIENNKFIVRDTNVSSLNISYSINSKKFNSKKPHYFIYIILFILILGFLAFYFSKNKLKSKKEKKNNLLLGLDRKSVV